MLKKNDLVQLTIEDIGTSGEGIGKMDGYTLFVKDAIIGDVVEAKVMKVKKNYGFARLMRVLSPSPDRVTPKCPLARSCGGCQIQEMAYPRQLLYKEDKVWQDLFRIGEVPESILSAAREPIVGMGPEDPGFDREAEAPYRYRNKAQFPIGTDKEGHPVAGFFAGRTHSIIPVTDCLLQPGIDARIIRILLNYMEEFHIPAYDERTHTGLVRHVLIRSGFATGQVQVCLVINGRKLPHPEVLVKRLKELPGMAGICLCPNEKQTNVILGDTVEVLWGEKCLTDEIDGVAFRISPLSFYQVNPVQTEKLYQQVLDYAGLSGTETVWDLYCGIGTISLFLARYAKEVMGVEVVPQAVEDARENARINGIENAIFYEGKAEEILPGICAGDAPEGAPAPAAAGRPDVIVVDPPRKGCEPALLTTMADMAPDRIVYVSCDPATLARDVSFLRAHGYEVQNYRPFDCFCHTIHTETVMLLQKYA